jgi:Ca2+-binding RTX toxin-like protein
MATITGTNGNNTLTGTSRADVIRGLGGNDRVYANPGDDTIYGGTGNDGLYSQAGNDTVFGESGVDALFGNEGNDRLFGGTGNDWLDGGVGDNTILGNEGNDVLRSSSGVDFMDGGTGTDNLFSGAGNDTIIHSASGPAAESNDSYDGSEGQDLLMVNAIGSTVAGSFGARPAVVNIGQGNGGVGSLSLSDPEGTSFVPQAYFHNMNIFDAADESALSFWGSDTRASTVYGTNNNDIFRSSASNEVFAGGAGADAFCFAFAPQGSDAITGFDPTQDIITFNIWSEEGQLGDLQFVEPGNGHTIINTVDLAGNLTGSVDVDAVNIVGTIRDGMDYEHFFFA